MDTLDRIVLALWREACRRPRLDQSVPFLAAALAEGLPLAAFHLLLPGGRRRDPEIHSARARGFMEGSGGAADAVWEPWPDGADAIPRRVLAAAAGEPQGSPRAIPPSDGGAGGWILAPLAVGEGSSPVLVLALGPGEAPAERHLPLVAAAAEPLEAAVRNHALLVRLALRRAAAEADKVSALRRLDRDHILDTIVGESGGLRGVMERVDLVARSDMPVLLFGETGSGKEVIARAIHGRSLRARGPFIRVNCAAIAPELIDSELFGHEKGAFTGAVARRRGWFERAHRGTLLLDEIGELPPPAQVRLLRVLQEGAFERVGGEDPVRVDVRIVAATHADLPAMVQNRRFREDLWYRVAGFQVIVPPLRERRHDIPDLARYFLARAARHFGLRPLELTEDDLELLTAYDWPGNVRELATVMDRAAILGAGRTLEVAKALGAGEGGQGPWRAPQTLTPWGSAAPDASGPAPLATFDEAVRVHLERALAATRGRIEGERGAAQLLGVNPHTLRARMRRLGLDWARFRE